MGEADDRRVRMNDLATRLNWSKSRLSHQLARMQARGLVERAECPSDGRGAFAVLALYSVFVQGVGVFFYPKGHWDSTPTSVDNAPDRLWEWQDNPIVRTVRGGL